MTAWPPSSSRDGIEDSSRHQWRVVSQGRGIFPWQVFVKDECFHRSFDILRVHKRSRLGSGGLVALPIGYGSCRRDTCCPLGEAKSSGTSRSYNLSASNR